mmetsp:Transcript_29485/g.42170  ORF Transcript_29485/g.42170 Transcript_29485/m.42170 type:complete len:739 (-) Transcript_29485:31-2247(-)|eukprot:CAMPEP_0172433184 /NCGR_PEP_ID=MMETSP1064-20121228/66875_1 /TAXON_ID=202472 /ORGANISM="Aulacoseira subarctica , Strain CCAP 1002/5" /LENGTH=738 /DNA_ID=CAMNT_0013180965 /DNA_START=13 /DNA_END=2229 /DNA_ORIENTATION=-
MPLFTNAIRSVSWHTRNNSTSHFSRYSFLSLAAASRMKVHPEVEHAISTNQPVVALESTIVAHGMPYPQNYQVAMEVESIVRSKGAVPATIAIRNGICCIGLSSDELHDLAKTGRAALKCTTRDLPMALKNNVSWGATTVASTAFLAHRSKIATFVTGGIGGVHRGNDLDISADLIELSRTPVIVVSTGIKSLLDIPKTLEYLETFGVPVVTYGSDYLPTFFSTSSTSKKIKSPYRIDTVQDAAQLYWSARDLGLSSGMLVAVPNPAPISDGDTKDGNIGVEDAIQDALSRAASLGIQGKDVTPFVLQAVAQQTGGESLTSNIELICCNASVGADIAIEIAASSKIRNSYFFLPAACTTESSSSTSAIEAPRIGKGLINTDVIVMGGAVVDIVAKPSSNFLLGTSNIGTAVQCDGGVGRNIAEVLGRLGANPIFYSAVGGKDTLGKSLIERLQKECGVQVGPSNIANLMKVCGEDAAPATVLCVEDARTATYIALLSPNNELHAAIAADMEIFENIPIPSVEQIEHSKFLVLDANPPNATLLVAAKRASSKGVCVVFEPTSVPKAARVVADDFEFLNYVTYATPSLDELLAMATTIAASSSIEQKTQTPTTDNNELGKLLSSVKDACSIVLPKMNWQGQSSGAHLIVTLGECGVLHACAKSSQDNHECKEEALFYYTHYEVPRKVRARNCTGAGDTLCGAFVHALLQGKTESDAIRFGMEAALKSVLCESQTISPNIV